MWGNGRISFSTERHHQGAKPSHAFFTMGFYMDKLHNGHRWWLQGKERASLFLITTGKGIGKHLLSLLIFRGNFPTWTIPWFICSSWSTVKMQEAIVDGKIDVTCGWIKTTGIEVILGGREGKKGSSNQQEVSQTSNWCLFFTHQVIEWKVTREPTSFVWCGRWHSFI